MAGSRDTRKTQEGSEDHEQLLELVEDQTQEQRQLGRRSRQLIGTWLRRESEMREMLLCERSRCFRLLWTGLRVLTGISCRLLKAILKISSLVFCRRDSGREVSLLWLRSRTWGEDRGSGQADKEECEGSSEEDFIS